VKRVPKRVKGNLIQRLTKDRKRTNQVQKIKNPAKRVLKSVDK